MSDQKAELLIEQIESFLKPKGFEVYGKQIYLTKKGIKLNLQIRELNK